MAFFLKTSIAYHLGSHSQARHRYHVELGTREKALLEEDPALKRFNSHKKSVCRLKRIGDVLTIVVGAGCCDEIYVKAVMRAEARRQAKGSA